jgi:hypothetical protein
MTVAEIDEQRRQEEAERVNRLYDLPMDTDGPRFDEPVTDRFAPRSPTTSPSTWRRRRRTDRSGARDNA